MEGQDDKFGWEDVRAGGGPSTGGGAAGGGFGEVPAVGDAVTSAMVNHFAREFSKGSMSYFPQIVSTARRYFNVTHGYVLRKCLWQLVPMTSTKKKSTDGELGADKDWTVRVADGLEVDIEEPDLYIPLMGFTTYVILCGLIRGLQETFSPDVISSTVTFAMVALILETACARAVLFTAGAINTPTLDLAALLGYKFFYLSLHLIFGLLLGWGGQPTGFLFRLLALGFVVACCVALWQALRRLARMHPMQGQECVTEMHKVVVQALAAAQSLVYYVLLPTWPPAKALASAAAAAAAAAAAGAADALPEALAAAANATQAGGA